MTRALIALVLCVSPAAARPPNIGFVLADDKVYLVNPQTRDTSYLLRNRGPIVNWLEFD